MILNTFLVQQCYFLILNKKHNANTSMQKNFKTNVQGVKALEESILFVMGLLWKRRGLTFSVKHNIKTQGDSNLVFLCCFLFACFFALFFFSPVKWQNHHILSSIFYSTDACVNFETIPSVSNWFSISASYIPRWFNQCLR